MSQWYLSKNGQALGPLEENKVVALIQEGELSPVDLVYQMGATEWMPLSEVETFSQYFKKQSAEPTPQGSGDKVWVILKKVVSEKGKEYKQLGPFSVAQVFQMIDQGEAKFSDFAWKQGMETWVKIAEIAEFDSPLPSSPPVDPSLYEKTNVDFEVPADTVVDKEQKASLTELVNIEHFQHEKTMVQPMRSPDRLKPETESLERPQAQRGKAGKSHKEAMEDERTSDLEAGEKALFAEISEMTPIPINEESFVTDSEITNVEGDESDISLWSLEPPSNKKKAEEATEVVSKSLKNKDKPVQDKKKKDKPKPKPKPKKQGEGLSIPALTTETWQWIGVISAVVFALIFFYASFRGPDSTIEYDESRQFDPESGMIINEPAKPFQSNEIEEKMADYREKLRQARQEKPNPVAISGSKVSQEVIEKIAPAPPGPIVPIAEKDKSSIQAPAPPPEEVKKPLPKKVKVVQKKPAAKVEPTVKVVEEKSREVAGKKKLIDTRAKIMQKTKKKPVPVKPAKSTQTAKTQSPIIAVAAGGAKAQSYFKQRDRLALFYSSLKAETLAVEIANQYTKLKGSQTAWARYYGQWKKKVQASLARDIREFPKSKETYAYPKVLADFKKDYALFYKYGESFDAKVKGLRTPSEGPANMREIFSRYKQTAQSLGK